MNARIVITALVCAVLGAAAGWFLRPYDAAENGATQAEGRDQTSAEAPAVDPQLGSELTVLKAELDSAQKAHEAETAKRVQAERTIERLQQEMAGLRESAAKGTMPDAPKVAAGTRYDFEKFSDRLKGIDWDVAGDAVANMSPLLGAYAKSIEEGKPPPPSVGQIQRYNGPLVTAALQAQQSGMPGTGTNGAFTHISVLANLVYVTLVKAGRPLSEAQEKSLRSLADDLLKEDERRLAGYSEETFALEKIIQETALKDRFYDAVDRLVTDEQREILHPASLRGRVSFDLFSSGLVWLGVMKSMRYAESEELGAKLTPEVMTRFGIDARHKGIVEDVVAEWVKSFPDGYLATKADALAAQGRHAIGRVRIAADRQLAMLKSLVSRLPADAPAAAKARAEPVVVVPTRL